MEQCRLALGIWQRLFAVDPVDKQRGLSDRHCITSVLAGSVKMSASTAIPEHLLANMAKNGPKVIMQNQSASMIHLWPLCLADAFSLVHTGARALVAECLLMC
jgi:hypothetical protein